MARRLDTTSAVEVDVHLVPAVVEHNGPAAVSAYFRPQPTGAVVDGLPVLACSLRGRSLPGACLPLPDGYTGAVLLCRQQEVAEPATGSGQEGGTASCGAQGLPAGARTSWVASEAFSRLHYYNHDAAPLRGDPLRRCLEWTSLAAAVHAPVDPAAVHAAVQPQAG